MEEQIEGGKDRERLLIKRSVRKNRKTGSEQKLAGLMRLLVAKVDDIERNLAEKMDDVKTQIAIKKRSLQRLTRKMVKDNGCRIL